MRRPSAPSRAGLGEIHQQYIDGKWVDAAGTFSTHSPIDTSVVIGHFQDGTAEDIDRAMTAARRAFPAWRDTPWQERVSLLRKVADLISERLFDIAAADSLEVGKNRLESLGDVEEAADFIRSYCAVMEQAWWVRTAPSSREREFSQHERAKALWRLGCHCPVQFPQRAFRGSNGCCPPRRQYGRAQTGRGHALHAYPADPLFSRCRSPGGCGEHGHRPKGDRSRPGRSCRVSTAFTFTGSYRVGMEIYAKVAQGPRPRPVITEMGGKNPAIVGQSADLEMAAEGVTRAAFGLTGAEVLGLFPGLRPRRCLREFSGESSSRWPNR